MLQPTCSPFPSLVSICTAKICEQDSRLNPIHPEFYKLFSQKNTNPELLDWALPELSALAPEVRATLPFFEDAHAVYLQHVLFGIREVFESDTGEGKRAAFLNLIKSSQNSVLPETTRQDLCALKESLSERMLFRRLDLENCDLSRLDLGNLDLIKSYLSHAKLIDANLSNTKLSDATMLFANLSGANLTNARLSHADLLQANLRFATLVDVQMIRAQLPCADISGADLTRANLTGTCLHRAILTGATLHAANLSDADLTKADLNHADMRYADLQKAQFKDASMLGTDRNGANTKNARDLPKIKTKDRYCTLF